MCAAVRQTRDAVADALAVQRAELVGDAAHALDGPHKVLFDFTFAHY